MSLPDSGAIGLHAIAVALGKSTFNISLSSCGGTLQSGHTTNVHMSDFYTPAAPMASFDSFTGYITIDFADSWPASSTYDFFRSDTMSGVYTTLASGQSSPSYTDATVILGNTYYYKVALTNGSTGIHSLNSDPTMASAA